MPSRRTPSSRHASTRILGLDPGLNLTGYGCIDAAPCGTPTIVEAGVLRLGRKSRVTGPSTEAATSRDARSISSRLVELFADLSEAIERMTPDLVAIEQVFAHWKHPATGVVMGHARGVMLLAVARAGLELVELRPNEVKKSLTGHGHASKGQMQRAIQGVFGLEAPPSPPDVADALAIALCAANRSRSPGVMGEGPAGTKPRRPKTKSARATSRDLARLLASVD
ncbi:MAG: crossover junction endodeoxyribonuclease RuvC [Phycisphaerales bacterium]|nr:MAG: crossover junction endodeoxyribonuclease RuvC [Phycisphaerales bacterium]